MGYLRKIEKDPSSVNIAVIWLKYNALLVLRKTTNYQSILKARTQEESENVEEEYEILKTETKNHLVQNLWFRIRWTPSK